MTTLMLINQPRDISLFSTLRESSPGPVDVGISHFRCGDEYGWEKPKRIEPCMADRDIEDCREIFGSVTVIDTPGKYHQTISRYDRVISRGREFFVCRPGPTHHIALSLNRCYFNRLLDVLPHYGDRMSICMLSEAWLDRGLCGDFLMSPGQHDVIERHHDQFFMANPYQPIMVSLRHTEHNAVRDQLGIPHCQPVAFVSHRKAAKALSAYPNADAYMHALTGALRKLRERGYFVICRRRLGLHDRAYAEATGGPEIARWAEVAPYIDLELNGAGAHPGDLWRGLYVSDLMLLADASGIGCLEAPLAGCPVWFPGRDSVAWERQNPSLRDMDRIGALPSRIPEHGSVWLGSFIKRWFSPNDFWSSLPVA